MVPLARLVQVYTFQGNLPRYCCLKSILLMVLRAFGHLRNRVGKYISLLIWQNYTWIGTEYRITPGIFFFAKFHFSIITKQKKKVQSRRHNRKSPGECLILWFSVPFFFVKSNQDMTLECWIFPRIRNATVALTNDESSSVQINIQSLDFVTQIYLAWKKHNALG